MNRTSLPQCVEARRFRSRRPSCASVITSVTRTHGVLPRPGRTCSASSPEVIPIVARQEDDIICGAKDPVLKKVSCGVDSWPELLFQVCTAP